MTSPWMSLPLCSTQPAQLCPAAPHKRSCWEGGRWWSRVWRMVMGFCVGKAWWGGQEGLEGEEQVDEHSLEPLVRSSPGVGSGWGGAVGPSALSPGDWDLKREEPGERGLLPSHTRPQAITFPPVPHCGLSPSPEQPGRTASFLSRPPPAWMEGGMDLGDGCP